MLLRRHYNAIAAALRSGGMNEFHIHEVSVALERESLECSNNTFNADKFETKALNGATQEQRSKQYRAQLKRIKQWRQSHEHP